MATKRILLIHAFPGSMAPAAAAFARHWPEAEVLNLLDEALYADVTPEGVVDPDVPQRVASILRHGQLSRADGIVFTGSTFGPAVDAGREGLSIPVLKADEAMAELIATEAGSAAILCTAARAQPVIRGNIDRRCAAAGTAPELQEILVEGAKAAISAGDNETHDRLVAEAICRVGPCDMIVLGQMSMVPALSRVPDDIARRVMTTADAAVPVMRRLVGG